MDLTPASERAPSPPPPTTPPGESGRDQSGIALFMVISAMTVLSVLVTEFVYIAQVNQRMAFDGLDQLRAHYLAKSGFKLSLLRLKAYQNVKGVVGGDGKGGGGVPGVPKALLEKIWSFPFFYPLPTNVPGMSLQDKEQIEKFQTASGLEGSFSANIDSESSKYNLNLILAPFVPAAPTGPSGASGPSGPPSDPGHQGTSGQTGPSGFSPEAARKSLADFLFEIYNQKITDDQDFADQNRDFKLEDLMENITAWADWQYQPQNGGTSNPAIKPKKAPFYTVNELHMIPPMDDTLFNLFSPALTASTTPGINVNTMKPHTLKALVPDITKEESDEFFKKRDNEEEDNAFKAPDDFFKYLQTSIGYFHNDDKVMADYKKNLDARNIRIVVDETIFKITVQAQVNQATRLIEAWVTLGALKKDASGGGAKPPPPGAPPPLAGPGGDQPPRPDSGLKVTFMRIL